MKRTSIRWTSTALIVAMLVSLLAPFSAMAAAVQLRITNLYTVPITDPPTPDEITSTNDPDVIRVTVNPITISVTIDGITDDKINDIYYEATNMNSGALSVNKTNKAAKSGSNEVTFSNVTLTEGLNKIVIKYGDTSVVSSRAGWAYFTPVTNITNLQFNGENFVDNGIYPKNPPYQSLNITGLANNATQMQAYVGGTMYGPTVFNKGDFTYITNTGRATDLTFKPGDNEMRFLAQNNTNSYTIDRSFVYDNGRAFPYNSTIDVRGGNSPKKLIQTPTLTKATTTSVSVNAKLKVPVSVTNVTYYDFVDVYIPGPTYKIRYDVKNMTKTSSGSGNDVSAISSVAITEDSTASVSQRYKVFNFVDDLPTNPALKYQEVIFEFGTVADGIMDTVKYPFYAVDPNTPYVDHVDYVISNTATVKVNETGSTQINRFPSTLQIYTTDDAESVKVEIGGALYTQGGGATQAAGIYAVSAPVAPALADAYGKGPDGQNMKRGEIVLQGLPDGVTSLKITPRNGGGAEFAQGMKTYTINISAAPYVILNYIYSGQVFAKYQDIGCGGGATPCFEGRIVNLPDAEYDNVVFQVNEKIIDISANITKTGADKGKFTIPTTADLVNELRADGKKTIKFSLKVNGKVVTESSYEIFILSDNIPFVTKLGPIESNPVLTQFKSTAPDMYVTTATEVSLTGEVRNSSRTGGKTEYTISYTIPGTTDKVFTTFISANQVMDKPSDLTNKNFTETFTTAVIPLPKNGDYYFEIQATNTSGITATKTVKITKEVQPYVIQQPVLIRNEEGKDQANINANFQEIRIFAEKADSVLIGKAEAKKNGDIFTYEVTDLKPGKNEVKFTVNRGTAKTNGSIILYNVNTALEGAQYKNELQSTMKVFDGDIELKFPKDTKLMRYDRAAANQYLTTVRKILFGIADIDSGRVDKVNENTSGQPYLNGSVNTNRFKAASKLYWIDAGTIKTLNTAAPDYQTKLKEALEGSGTLPVPPSDPTLPAFYARDLNDIVVPTKRLSLTLKYDPSIRDDAWKYVTVFQYNRYEDMTGGGTAEQGWRNIGGIVDTKKNTITVEIDSFGYFQVLYMNDSFEDVTNHPWARNDLDTLYSKGLMLNKDPGGRFLPNDAITRGEFITMLVRIFDIPLKNDDTLSRVNNPNDPNYQGTFGDVRRGYTIPNSNGLYDYMHIEAAARAGIVRGTSQGLFLPNNVITRQDAAVMIARAAELKTGTDDKKLLDSLQKTFTDGNTIDIYARGAVEAVAKAGFIEGKPNELLPGQKNTTLRFDPNDNFTRAEAAVVAMRVLKHLKKIPK